jgi:hypothetical protein
LNCIFRPPICGLPEGSTIRTLMGLGGATYLPVWSIQFGPPGSSGFVTRIIHDETPCKRSSGGTY